MHYDALLLYLSDVADGSWARFKRAAATVRQGERDDDAANVARVLSALGHAEFAWEPSARWAICPPTLAALPRRPQPATVLCGQRLPALLESLRTAAAPTGISIEEYPQAGGPATIYLRAPRWELLEQLAGDTHVRYVPHAAEYLAACLPPLDALVAASPRSPRPVVPPIAAFDPQAWRWIEASRASGDGLYQYENFYPDYRLLQDGQWRLVGKEVGVYAVLDRTAWTYDPNRQLLRIPARLLPPPLYQRALILCSGLLATFDHTDRHWVFRDVPPAIASTLGRNLHQTL